MDAILFISSIGKTAMPTTYKPQLNHASFRWSETSDKFLQELTAQRAAILELSGFNEEFRDSSGSVSCSAASEGDAFLLELSGILALAAAIKVDAGKKATNQVIATLRAIEKAPNLILKTGVEPESLAMVAANYQRGDEVPGTYWFDVDGSGDQSPPDLQQVVKAARGAIAKLESDRQTGRPEDLVLSFLGDSLLRCYLRFNAVASRHSIAASSDGAQVEAGPFFEFLTIVIGPLNQYFKNLPASVGKKTLSAAQIARVGLKNHASQQAGRPARR